MLPEVEELFGPGVDDEEVEEAGDEEVWDAGPELWAPKSGGDMAEDVEDREVFTWRGPGDRGWPGPEVLRSCGDATPFAEGAVVVESAYLQL